MGALCREHGDPLQRLFRNGMDHDLPNPIDQPLGKGLPLCVTIVVSVGGLDSRMLRWPPTN
jgi:hypothetical protein